MKKLILIAAIALSLPVLAQQKDVSMYKDYKACTECFDKFKTTPAQKTGLENFGISYPAKKIGNQAGNKLKGVAAVVVSIVVVSLTYTLYSKTNNFANEIR